MNFSFTEEQKQLSNSLQRWLGKNYDFEHRQRIIASDLGASDAAWAGITELGLTALPVPESNGGFSASAVDMLAVMQELGKGLFIEPYFATACSVEFLKLAGSQHAVLLEKIANGSLKLAYALAEKQSRYDLFNIATTAVLTDEHYVLNGTKTVVLHGAQADWLIVSARTNGNQLDTQGISLFVISSNTANLSIQDYRTIDGMRAANITLSGVRVEPSALIGQADHGWPLIDAVADFGAVLLSAEAIGVMDALYAVTLEYLKTRHQFQTPIGKFQVLQHRMAEMFVELEQARSMVMLAATKIHTADEQERRRTVSAAKARVGQAAKFVGQYAVQLHGGIGMTNELLAAHYFKRLTTIEQTLGDIDYHIERFVDQPSFSGL